MDKVNIPKTIHGAFSELDKMLLKDDKDYIIEVGHIVMHHTLGRWIRNNWGYPQYMCDIYIKGYHQAEKDHQQTKELLKMLLEAIDYSFVQTDGTYDLTLTYPVIDKVKYIKQKLRENI